MTVKIEPLPTLDPIAFTFALIGAPILVAVAGFWAFLIPVAALILGGPVYLIVGTPILMWMVTRYPLAADIYACAGFLVHCALIIGLSLGSEVFGDQMTQDLIPMSLFGLIFAPIWSAVFATLYRRWYRPARLYPVL